MNKILHYEKPLMFILNLRNPGNDFFGITKLTLVVKSPLLLFKSLKHVSGKANSFVKRTSVEG